MDLIISPIKASEIKEVSDLLANSMCTNPNHLSMFQSADETSIRKQSRMFELVLKDSNLEGFTARLNGEIVGVMGFTSSEHCQMPVLKLLRSLPVFISIFGKHLAPVLKWRQNWAKHDCKSKHIHFGPLAVHKDHQAKGIGKVLLSHFCSQMDAGNQTSFLETDKIENVALYQKFGFHIAEKDTLFGNENWFMLRPNAANIK